MTVRTLGICLLLPALACATAGGPDDPHDRGDDDSTRADAGFVDAAEPAHGFDAGPADARPSAPIDAAPSGQICSDDSQCNLAAHECCWKFLVVSGVCTYGNVVPLFGCVPADPPADAGM
jgi:hypothetical protein